MSGGVNTEGKGKNSECVSVGVWRNLTVNTAGPC